MEVLVSLIAGVAVGALLGLIPFCIGRRIGKPGMGRLALLCCTLSGLLFLSFPVTIGFIVALYVSNRDCNFPQSSGGTAPAPRSSSGGGTLGVKCLSGPLKGQIYRLSGEGMMIGRDHDCAIRFASETPGISRHHCSIRWQQGNLMLTDLNSAYGTWLSDGRKLPPQYPTQLTTGSRFYLASPDYMFQIVITV